MSQRKRRPGGRPAARPPVRRLPPSLLAGLTEAASLMERQRWPEAAAVLEKLNRNYPGREEVLELRLDAAQEIEDVLTCQTTASQLLKFRPDHPDLLLVLASAYLTNTHPALALTTFRSFVERWPEHEQAPPVRAAIAGIEGHLETLLAELGVSGDEGMELALLHEQTQALLAQGQYPQARQVGRQLLARLPEFAPVLNNISQAYWLEGRPEQAMATAREVLAFAPENVHALSNLARFACLSGRMEEAREYAEHLKASAAPGSDREYKVAEALSYLGDDAGVLEVYQRARERGRLEDADPLFHHVAAVAALRLGREKDARRFWKVALEEAPGLALARENLLDLDGPSEGREGPWAFPFQNWITPKAHEDLASLLAAGQRVSERALTESVCAYLRRHPEIPILIPLLLDRGDPRGRQFALRIARMAATLEMAEALKDFAVSRRGPDSLRMEAAQAALSEGLIAPGFTSFWLKGERQELMLMGYELHDEPTASHAPEVEKRLIKAVEALKRGAGDVAERELLAALEAEPDAPDIMNNLAGAYELQGHGQAAHALVRQIHETHPDYVFAATNLASVLARQGEIEEAKALLEPVMTRRRLHFNEFASLCIAQIEVSLAENAPDVARSWLEMWEGADPDHPHLERSRSRINSVRPRKTPIKKGSKSSGPQVPQP